MIHAYNYPFKILTEFLWTLGELLLDLVNNVTNRLIATHTLNPTGSRGLLPL
jgi:hypothetical protein